MNIPPNQKGSVQYPTSSMNNAVHEHWEIRKNDTVSPVYLCASHVTRASRFEAKEDALAHMIARRME
jgi:hypothetical protein